MIRRLVRGLVIVAGAWIVVAPSAQTPPPPTPPPQTPPPAAPQTPPPQQPTFRTGIDTVSVDVSVSDKQGRPVTDLQIGDFEIRENKQPQPIQTFKMIQIDDFAAASAPMTDILNERDHDREVRREDNRLFVIFLDDYHTQRINSMRIREQLATFVSNLTNNDLVAVMTPLTEPTALGFSYNHDATARIVYAFEGRKYDYRPRNPLEERTIQLPPDQIEAWRNSVVMNAIESTCQYIGALRPGRKTLLFVSEGLSSSVPLGMMIGGFGSGSQSQTALASDLQTRWQRVYQAAARANTSITTFDPRGLATDDTMATSPAAMEQARTLRNESIDGLRSLAGETDGRAIVGSNNPMPGFQQMLRDLSAYYLLGYRAASPHDGKFHEIQVRVNRKDVDVHARKGYWAYTEEEAAKASAPPKPPPPADLTAALGGLASTVDRVSGKLVRAWMGATRGEGDKAIVTFAWETVAATRPAEPADVVDHLVVTATHVTGQQLFSGRVPSDPQNSRPGGFVTFEAPPGNIRVKVVPENARDRRLDDQDETFDVPNLSGAKPVITVPTVYRGRTIPELRQLKAAASPMPAITREFQRTERLLLRFQAVGPGGAAPTSLTMKILNQQGNVMATMPAPTATPKGYEAEVGLNAFPSGTYVIEISGDFSGQTARSLIAIRTSG
jgi:VWFA-related protein